MQENLKSAKLLCHFCNYFFSLWSRVNYDYCRMSVPDDDKHHRFVAIRIIFFFIKNFATIIIERWCRNVTLNFITFLFLWLNYKKHFQAFQVPIVLIGYFSVFAGLGSGVNSCIGIFVYLRKHSEIQKYVSQMLPFWLFKSLSGRDDCSTSKVAVMQQSTASHPIHRRTM